LDTNPHRKPYDESVAKYWRDWYHQMTPEQKKEFNRKRYLRAKALKAERESKRILKDNQQIVQVDVSNEVDAVSKDTE